MNDDESLTQNLPIGAAEMLRAEWQVGRVLTIVAIVAAVTAAVMIPLGGKLTNIGIIIAILTSLPALLGAIEWSRLSSLRRGLQSLSGEHLVHWSYASNEWQAFDAKWTADQPVGETYIGASEAYCNRTYVDWNRLGRTLLKIDWKDGPVAELNFLIFYANPKTKGITLLFRVPVPAGREAEARRLVETLEKDKKIVDVPGWGKAILILAIVVMVAVLALTLAIAFGIVK